MIESVVSFISQFDSCAVAMSAGVDSAVVAKAAFLALDSNAIAVTAQSPSLAAGELEQAQQLAELIGIEHQILQTSEFSNPSYIRNQGDRCYHCKSELYGQMDALAKSLQGQTLLNGTNTDDLGDYRPGLQAASESNVRSPLAECEINKTGVRAVARYWQLPIWDKPASPCLSSRVAYGEEVTPERLQMIDQAEQYLRSQGINPVRVRYHRGDLARIEVPQQYIERIADMQTRKSLEKYLRGLGFQFVTIDLGGFKSGSLNQLLQIDTS
ncbi:MAG: TIGR00268 family protein [Planctomycetaceae bacterium]|nr:TIGR00268 family protein [Planctomycetaceae bacterium]